MGLFGNWTTVDDTYVFQPASLVRFYVEYGHVPATKPSNDEMINAFSVISGVQVQSIDESLWDSANVGHTQNVVVGIMKDSLSAGQLRGQIYNGLNVLNANRISPLWQANVDDIQASDTRSTAKQLGVNLPGDTSGGPATGQPDSSSGFAVSTTIIVVAVAIAIVAVAAVVHKGEGLL